MEFPQNGDINVFFPSGNIKNQTTNFFLLKPHSAENSKNGIYLTINN